MSYTNSKEERLSLIPKLVEAVATGDESKIDAVFAQDFKWIIPGTGGKEAKDIPLPPGIAGPKALIGAWHKGFSNFKFSAQKSIPEEDGGENIVATRAEWSGTHTGEFMGIPPTGKDVSVRLTAFDKIENGKLRSSEVIVDIASLLVQLGVMPPPKGF